MRLIDVDKLKFREGLNVEGTLFVTLEDISKAPTADAEPVRHGHWIVEKTASGSEYTRCSKCGLDFSWKDTKFGLHKLDMRGCDYCPACGAKMDETKGEQQCLRNSKTGS